MIQGKPGNRALQNILNANAPIIRRLPKQVGIVERYPSGEVYALLLIISVPDHILLQKLAEPFVDHLGYPGVFQMMKSKTRELRQIPIRLRLSINMIQHLSYRNIKPLLEWCS